MSLGLLVGFLIIVACFAWALMPLFAARQPRQRTEAESATRSLEDLLFAREGALTAIRDLQLDHSMGKLGDADYTELDAQYRAEAISLMQQLDALGVSPDTDDADAALDAWIERAVANARNAGARSVPPSRASDAEPPPLSTEVGAQ